MAGLAGTSSRPSDLGNGGKAMRCCVVLVLLAVAALLGRPVDARSHRPSTSITLSGVVAEIDERRHTFALSCHIPMRGPSGKSYHSMVQTFTVRTNRRTRIVERGGAGRKAVRTVALHDVLMHWVEVRGVRTGSNAMRAYIVTVGPHGALGIP